MRPKLAFSLPPGLPLELGIHSIEREFERLISKTWRTIHIFSFSHNTTMGFELNATMIEVLMRVRPNVHIFTNDRDTARGLQHLFGQVSSSVKACYWTGEDSLFHIKSLIIDRKHVYLGSANFSISAMTKNAEAGLFFEDESIAESLIQYAEELQRVGLLTPLEVER